jgi:hypothetical protein
VILHRHMRRNTQLSLPARCVDSQTSTKPPVPRPMDPATREALISALCDALVADFRMRPCLVRHVLERADSAAA